MRQRQSDSSFVIFFFDRVCIVCYVCTYEDRGCDEMWMWTEWYLTMLWEREGKEEEEDIIIIIKIYSHFKFYPFFSISTLLNFISFWDESRQILLFLIFICFLLLLYSPVFVCFCNKFNLINLLIILMHSCENEWRTIWMNYCKSAYVTGLAWPVSESFVRALVIHWSGSGRYPSVDERPPRMVEWSAIRFNWTSIVQLPIWRIPSRFAFARFISSLSFRFQETFFSLKVNLCMYIYTYYKKNLIIQLSSKTHLFSFFRIKQSFRLQLHSVYVMH